MKKDTISIAIATYNGDRFLREQLDSLYAQNRIPDEIIVCDDCSTDATPKILEEYHQKYGLIYYVNENPLGVNKNFFKAISLCSGEYICICDQDDIWLPNKIETLYEAIKTYDKSHPNCVSSQCIDIDAKGNIIGNTRLEEDSEGWQATLLTTGRSQGCTMIMNDALKNRVLYIFNTYSIADEMMYDGLTAFIAAIEGNKKNLGAQLMYYRRHDRNVAAKYNTHQMTLRERMIALPTYYPFLTDERIRNLSIMHSLYIQDNIGMEMRIFLTSMKDLYLCTSIFKGLKIISTLHIPTKIKLKTCILAPIGHTIKSILIFFDKH